MTLAWDWIALGGAATLWGLWCIARPRFAIRALLLWVPVQGWLQLNLFANANWSVLLYECQMALVYVAVTLAWVLAPHRWRPPKIIVYVLPFLIWCVLLVPASLENLGSLPVLVALRAYIFPLPMIWVGYRALRDRHDLTALATWLMAEMFVIGLIAAVQFRTWVAADGTPLGVPLGFGFSGSLRAPGTFSSAGHLGMYLLAMIPLGLGFLQVAVGRWPRRLVVAGLAGGVVALAVNSQRATVIELAVVVPLMFLLSGRVTVRHVTRSVVLVGMLFAAGAVMTGGAFWARLVSVQDNARNALVDAPIERMRDALRTPIIGRGLGSAALPGLPRVDVESVEAFPAESFMAALVFQLGIPGLVWFYLLLVGLLVAGYQALQQCQSRDMKMMAAAIIAYQVAVWLQSWTYDPLHYPPGRVIFWFWAGVLLALPKFDAPLVTNAPSAAAASERAAP